MTTRSFSLLGALVLLAVSSAFADQVVMQNGDRYNGKVLSVTTNTVSFQSDVLGAVNLSRSKVATITMGNVAPAPLIVTGQSPVPPQRAARQPLDSTNANAEISAQLRSIASQTNVIQQVQSQYLANAGPEANQKFEQMMGDIASGRMSIDDLRSQAKAAIDQLQQAKKEAGDEAAEGVDSYVAILQSFLKDTAPSTSTSTNTAIPVPKARPGF